MPELHFECEPESIVIDRYCMIISKEIYNELKNVLKDAFNYEHSTQDHFKSTDELGNINEIRIGTDKGFGKIFEVRIKHAI